MPYPLPLTRTEAYLAYKAGVIQQSDLKPSLAVPRNGIDAWLAYWTGLTTTYPVKNVGKNLFDETATPWEEKVAFDGAGEQVRWTGYVGIADYQPVVPNTTYAFSNSLDKAIYYGLVFYDADKNKISFIAASSRTFTTPANCAYIRFAIKSSTAPTWTQLELGSTATAYEPYTGEPLILQEEEAYIAYLCGVINEYPEKCLRRVGAYLRYLISARWGRPDHPLNREELYLSLIKTQFIPSGDPSSDIEIDGTAKAAFQDLKMYGDTFQQTYSGKNLFNRENYGTLVGWAAQGEIKNYGNRVFYIQCKPGTTYTIQKMLAKPVERSRCQIFTTSDVPAVGVSVIGILFSTNDATQATVTTQNSANYLCIVCYEAVASTETTVQEMADSIMIEEGATASPYEPYVGLQPSPNPDYPQMVQTVTGLQTVEVAGKNLLNVNGIVLGGGYEGLTVQLVNKDESTGTIGIRLTGNVAPNLWSIYVRTNDIRLDPNTTYTLSRSFSESGGLRNAGGIRIKIGSSYTGTTTDASTTFTTDSTGIVQVLLYAAYNQQGPTSDIDSTVIFNNLLLEEGSTVTAFAPYSRHTHEINLGKNLFDKSKQVSGWLNSTGGISQPTSTTDKTSDYMTCSPNTSYTLSSSGYYLKIAQYDANKAFIKLDQSGNNIPSLTVNTDGNAAYIRISYGNADKEPNVQFEAGSATPYAPYFAPIELCKLGTYQDYIWKDGGDWKVHRANGYYALTDSVSITPSIDTSQPNTTRFQFTNILAEPSSTSGRTSLKCSHFKYSSMWNTDVVGIQTADYAQESSNTRFWFRIPKTIATTFNQLKSWLANNTVELYYPLATATDTIITNQPLIAQLEALVAGGAENGTTYIKVKATDPNLPGLLYVEAPKYE